MSFTAIQKQNLSEIKLDIFFDRKNAKSYEQWNFTDFFREFKKLNIETTNRTITDVLKNTHQKEIEIYHLFLKYYGCYAIEEFEKSEYYYNIQVIKFHLKVVALWLYDGKADCIPAELSEQLHIPLLDLKFTK